MATSRPFRAASRPAASAMYTPRAPMKTHNMKQTSKCRKHAMSVRVSPVRGSTVRPPDQKEGGCGISNRRAWLRGFTPPWLMPFQRQGLARSRSAGRLARSTVAGTTKMYEYDHDLDINV